VVGIFGNKFVSRTSRKDTSPLISISQRSAQRSSWGRLLLVWKPNEKEFIKKKKRDGKISLNQKKTW
jgi:hypothetical protein